MEELSGVRAHYQHRAEIEAVVQGVDHDVAFDTLTAGIGAALAADRTLGGLCDWIVVLRGLPRMIPWIPSPFINLPTEQRAMSKPSRRSCRQTLRTP